MAIYSNDASELVKEFQTALQLQHEAMKHLSVALTSGDLKVINSAADTIDLHNNRVMDLDAKLQAFRLDKN